MQTFQRAVVEQQNGGLPVAPLWPTLAHLSNRAVTGNGERGSTREQCRGSDAGTP
jgi:hypothetical protein